MVERKYGANSEVFINSLPDTNAWGHIEQGPMTHWYYRHPAFNYYPLVTISHEQANAYCQWRTDSLNSFFSKKHYWKQERETSKTPYKINCRLPTEKEWMSVTAEYTDSIKVQLLKSKYTPTGDSYNGYRDQQMPESVILPYLIKQVCIIY